MVDTKSLLPMVRVFFRLSYVQRIFMLELMNLKKLQ